MEFDPEFNNEFNRVFNNTNVPEANDYTPEILEDTYFNMELAMPRGQNDGPEFAKVTKRLRDANGLLIGTKNDNPLLNTRIYEVEYTDAYKASLTANSTAMNIYAQVNDEGNLYVLFSSIIHHRNDGTDVKIKDYFIKYKNSGRRRKETTKGWEILVMCKDGSSAWETLKDMEGYYPVQVS